MRVRPFLNGQGDAGERAFETLFFGTLLRQVIIEGTKFIARPDTGNKAWHADLKDADRSTITMLVTSVLKNESTKRNLFANETLYQLSYDPIRSSRIEFIMLTFITNANQFLAPVAFV